MWNSLGEDQNYKTTSQHWGVGSVELGFEPYQFWFSMAENNTKGCPYLMSSHRLPTYSQRTGSVLPQELCTGHTFYPLGPSSQWKPKLKCC